MDNPGNGFTNPDKLIPDETFRLGESITFWLGRTSHILQESFNRSVAEHDITWPQWMVLNVLFHGAAETPAQVADHLGVDRSAVTRLADRLCKKGFIERRQDGIDRRCVKLVLTHRGNKLIRQVNSEASVHQATIVDQLPDGSADEFVLGLNKILDALDVDRSKLS